MEQIKSFKDFFHEVYLVEWQSNGHKKYFSSRNEAHEYWDYSNKLGEEPKLKIVKIESLKELKNINNNNETKTN